ncbi:unnamed protein product, partial [Iphiclides podalirius]
MTTPLREELATLQRQVELLGRSLQSTTTPAPSNYQAPATHTTTAHGISKYPTSGARPNHTGDDATGHAATEQSSEQPDELHGVHNQTPGVTEQHHESPTTGDAAHDDKPNTTGQSEIFETTDQVNTDRTNETDQYQTVTDAEHPMDMSEPVHEQRYGDNFEHYEQNPETNTEYNQEYDKNQTPHEENETGYTEPQYENYEQYPQQYTEPNAQYDGQFENYPTDGNYQGEYNEPQYNLYAAEYQEHTPEAQQEAGVHEDHEQSIESPSGKPKPIKSEVNPDQTESNGS